MQSPFFARYIHGKRGFTLAELLIALAILGVIATFTIPKVLQAQQDNQNVSIAKEAAAMVYGGFQAYQVEHVVDASVGVTDLTPYLNYVAYDTGSSLDDVPGAGAFTCGSSNWHCLRLHNGALLWFDVDETFGGMGPTNIIQFGIDPDGRVNGTESVGFYIFANGRMTSYGSVTGMVESSRGPYGGLLDPSWFSWE